MVTHRRNYSILFLLLIFMGGYVLLGVQPSQSQEGGIGEINDLPPPLDEKIYLPLVMMPPEDFTELVVRFAPQLWFDSEASSFPMDAQKYWQEMLVTSGDEIPEECAAGPLPCIDGDCPDPSDCYKHDVGWGNEEFLALSIGDENYSTLPGGMMPTYYLAYRYPTTRQVRIEYWWFYGYNPKCKVACIGWEDHAADWEHIMVILSQDETEIAAVAYYQHAGWYLKNRGDDEPILPLAGDHPIIYVGKNNHGSYHMGGGGTACNNCGYWSDLRYAPYKEWNTWGTPLIDLNGNQQPWLARDRVRPDFLWSKEVGTHPTRYTTDKHGSFFNINACAGASGKTLGCLYGHSDCMVNWFECPQDDYFYCCPQQDCNVSLAGKDYLIPNTNDGLIP